MYTHTYTYTYTYMMLYDIMLYAMLLYNCIIPYYVILIDDSTGLGLRGLRDDLGDLQRLRPRRARLRPRIHYYTV